ncbi:MAG: PIN domain-containing protein [Candidatus Helarchaeota archaeon]
MNSRFFDLISYMNIEIDTVSNEVRDFGVLDYFDALIYATAKVQNAILITEDEILHEISSNNSIRNEVIRWREFVKFYL